MAGGSQGGSGASSDNQAIMQQLMSLMNNKSAQATPSPGAPATAGMPGQNGIVGNGLGLTTGGNQSSMVAQLMSMLGQSGSAGGASGSSSKIVPALMGLL